MSALAIRGTYADWRLVKTRQVIQIVLEVPLSDADQAYEIMGGMPNPGHERWFAIAAIKEVMPDNSVPTTTIDTRPQSSADRSAGAKHSWRDLSPAQQAGIRCDDPTFWKFLCDEYRDYWIESLNSAPECVRLLCRVQSRADLNTNNEAKSIWLKLNDQYEAWMRIG